MKNMILMIGGVGLFAVGAGIGFIGATQFNAPKQVAKVETIAQVDSSLAEEQKQASYQATAHDFAQGFSQALEVVALGREQSVKQADDALENLMAEYAPSFDAVGLSKAEMADRLSSAIQPSTDVQEEYDLMAQDMAMAQDIAQLAISERDTARIELLEALQSLEVLEEQLSNDAVLQGFDAERTRLMASLALEQQRVAILRDALEKSDAANATETEKTLNALGENDLSVAKLSEDIARLSKRYDGSLARLEEARAQTQEASNDLALTLDELEFANNQLTTVQTKLDETQAEFVNLERDRLTAVANIAELQANLEAKRTQIQALEIVGEITDMRDLTKVSTALQSDSGAGQPVLNEQAQELQQQISALSDLLKPLQKDFDTQVQQQAVLKAESLAEEIAQEMAQDIALERAKILANDIARDLADQLANERANILADLIADERLGTMTTEEIEKTMGVRVVTDEREFDDMSPLRAYLYQRLLAASTGTEEQRRLVNGKLLLSTNTLFPEGGVQLSAAGQNELRVFGEDLIDVLKEADEQTGRPSFTVQINGHADRRPFRRSRFGNWELSALRAVSVVEFLIKEVGVPADRLVAAAFAEHQPLVQGDTKDAYALNRRIEFRLVNQ